MITTKLYLDTRATTNDVPSPIKLIIIDNRKSAQYSTGIKVRSSCWNKKTQKIINLTDMTILNHQLDKFKLRVDEKLLELYNDGKLNGLSVIQIKKLLLAEFNPNQENQNTFLWRFENYKKHFSKKSTINIYNSTLSRMKQFEQRLDIMQFEDIDRDWLERFDKWLITYCPKKNARNIHFRNIRAVFNDAIDEGITTFYPFRKFKIRPEETIHRSLTREELKVLTSIQLEGKVEKARDIFLLMFYLCGINLTDLCNLKEIINGRIIFHRAKTNKLYSIKVEPEAMDIIQKYRGKKYLLDVFDDYKNVHTYTIVINKCLQSIAGFHFLTTYWARHTFATIASEIEITKETIAAALGHGGNSVTDIYIKFDQKKVDDAVRKVIDYVKQQ